MELRRKSRHWTLALKGGWKRGNSKEEEQAAGIFGDGRSSGAGDFSIWYSAEEAR